MRSLLAPIVAQLALLVAGLGALRAARVLGPFSLVEAAKAAGLAYLVGVALVMQTCILLLVVGLPFGLPTVAVVCLVLASPLALDLRRGSSRGPAARRALWGAVGRWDPRRTRFSDDRAVVVVTLGAFAALAVLGLVTLGNDPTSVYDAWNLWARKAGLLYFGSHLPLGVLSSTAGGYIHPDYPLVLPLLEALHLRALGQYEVSSVHTVIWALAVAFVWAGMYLGSRVARPAICALVFPGVVALVASELLTAYADVPMAFFLGLAVLALALWLQSGRLADLVVSMMLFAGAAGVKNEGVVGTIVVIAGGLIVLAAHRRWSSFKQLLIAGIAMGAFAIAPWHVWLFAHNLKGDIPFPGGFNPSYLLAHTDRLGPGLRGLYEQLINMQSIAVTVPIGIALILLRLRRPHRSLIVWFYLLAGVLYFLALVWAYWVNPIAIQFLVLTSANRVYVGLAFIALVGILHLGGTPVERPVGPPPSTEQLDGPVDFAHRE